MYIGNPPVVQATRIKSEFIATAGQTIFTPPGGYVPGFVDVTVNGSELQDYDFTATDGSTITLAVACAANDDVRIKALGVFSTANAYTKSEADARFPHLTGAETLAGDKTFSGIILPQAGIKFPAAQFSSSDANTLDDYEEGTWTPTLVRDATNPSVTYSSQYGWYIKIGNQVTVGVQIALSAVSSQGSGVLGVGGLPFTPNGGYACVGAVGYNTVLGTSDIRSWAANGSSRIKFHSGLTSGEFTGNIGTGWLSTTVTYTI